MKRAIQNSKLSAMPALSIFADVVADAIGAEALTRKSFSAAAIAALAAEAELYRGELVGNAWQNHLLDRLLDADNAFSRKAEQSGLDAMGAGVIELARADLHTLRTLWKRSDKRLDNFRSLGGGGPARAALKKRFAAAADWPELLPELVKFYATKGVGLFGRFSAFRWADGALRGIGSPDPVRLDELVGYDAEREQVIRNTEQFVAGYPANNVLLYGERGTGKSATVKALLNEFAPRGLRMIELLKNQIGDFADIVEPLRGRRERFILFVDDLSFEEGETGYSELKAVLEGSLVAKPDNVVIYATSNRRHLVVERLSDLSDPAQRGDEAAPEDTIEEKISLSDRFGIRALFLEPDQERYFSIVRSLAKRRQLKIAGADLDRRALRWAQEENGRSCRSARQFVDWMEGEVGLAKNR